MKKIKCAVIGVGYIGKFHAEKLAMLPQTELVALVDDHHRERTEELASKFPHPPIVLTDYRELVGKVEAVSIAATTRNHYTIAKFCLEHGLHVLVEKPITETAAEARELIHIAKSKGLVLQVGHLERFNAVHLALKGILNEPLFIESQRLAPYTPRGADVNVVFDLMIHDIDLIQAMVRSPIIHIDACGAPVLSSGIDIADARIKFENGCVANVTASRASLRTKRKMKIFQHDAYLSIDFHNRTLRTHRKGSEELFPGIPEIICEEQTFAQSDAIKAEMEAFAHAITTSTAPPVTGEDGLRALETATQITDALMRQLEYVKAKHPLHSFGD